MMMIANRKTKKLFSPSLNLSVFAIHAFLGVSTLISGIWLIALWRPRSTEFAAKSKRMAQVTTVLWVSSFAVGVVLFGVLNTALFG